MAGIDSVVRGLPLSQLARLLVDSSSIITQDTIIDGTRLGGWSNINLLARNGTQRIVVKFPALLTERSPTHYEQVARVYNILSSVDLAPSVLETGYIDEVALPFIVMTYIEGVVHLVPDELSPAEMSVLRSGLSRLNTLDIPGLPRYPDATSYLSHLIEPLRMLLDDPVQGTRIVDYATQVITLSDSVREACEGLSWSRKVMHGDLSESNLVFTQTGLVLLDLDSICIGDPLYDIAYLSVQNAERIIPWPQSIFEVEDRSLINSLQCLSLVSVLCWSILRLNQMNQGVIDNLLIDANTRQTLVRYILSKLKLLSSLCLQ
ncbi:MAG: phosphotransferase [Candidatus Thorarchaeota archaeon]